MNNDPSQEMPATDEAGADDSQVRPAVVPVVPAPARKPPPGRDTRQLAAVLDTGEGVLGPVSGSGDVGAIDPDVEPKEDSYALQLARDIRAEKPDFTAQKYRARASGAKATLQMPAPGVIRQRKMRRFAIIATILMIGTTVTIVVRLNTGVWPWTLLWQVIRAA